MISPWKKKEKKRKEHITQRCPCTRFGSLSNDENNCLHAQRLSTSSGSTWRPLSVRRFHGIVGFITSRHLPSRHLGTGAKLLSGQHRPACPRDSEIAVVLAIVSAVMGWKFSRDDRRERSSHVKNIFY